MTYLGKADFERFGWFHPDDWQDDYEWDGKLVIVSVQEDAIYHFVFVGEEFYDLQNFEVYQSAKLGGM